MTEINNGMTSNTSTLAREKALVKRNVYRPTLNTSMAELDEDTATHAEAETKKASNQPKGYAFWALVFALCVIALANFFLTVTIFSVLRLTKTMEAMEVVPSARLIKFFGDFEVNSLVKADGFLSGFDESPVTLTSLGSDMKLRVSNEDQPELKIGLDTVEFLNIESFEITEPRKMPRTSAFSTTFPNFGLPKGVQKLHIKKATANRITSGLNGPLVLRSESSIRMKGNEGVSLRGKEIWFKADQSLLLRSINGSVILDGSDGVVLDVDAMSITGQINSQEDTVRSVKMPEYKLCICMPSGQLFRIPVLEGVHSVQCDSVDLDGEDSPCE